jgi:hypothetical protein
MRSAISQSQLLHAVIQEDLQNRSLLQNRQQTEQTLSISLPIPPKGPITAENTAELNSDLSDPSDTSLSYDAGLLCPNLGEQIF